jgi:hypothetical protein
VNWVTRPQHTLYEYSQFVYKIIHSGSTLFILLYSMQGVVSAAVPAFVSVNQHIFISRLQN